MNTTVGYLGSVHGTVWPRSIWTWKHLFIFKNVSTCCYPGGVSVYPLLVWLMRPFPAMRAPGRRWLSCALICCLMDAEPVSGKMDTTCNPAEVPGSLVLFRVVGWEVNGTIFTKIMQRAFIGRGLEHHQFAGLAQATKQLICHHWEQSRRGRHCKGFVCLEIFVASRSAQWNRVRKCDAALLCHIPANWQLLYAVLKSIKSLGEPACFLCFLKFLPASRVWNYGPH